MPLKNKRHLSRRSTRNVVIQLALAERPSQAMVDRLYPKGCPFCEAAPGRTLLVKDEARRVRPALLTRLGIDCSRLIRNVFHAECTQCGASSSGSALHDYNVYQCARRFADMGSIRFPLPLEGRGRSLENTVWVNLSPKARKQVNRKGAVRLRRRLRLQDRRICATQDQHVLAVGINKEWN